MKSIFAILATVLLPVFASAEEGGFSEGDYGTHITCPVTLNEEGTRLEVVTGDVVSFLKVDEAQGLLVDETGRWLVPGETDFEMPRWFIMQQLANKWLIDQGFPSLWDMQADPNACPLVS
jgi:hypothetical protein